MNNDAVVVAELRPGFRRVGKIDGDAHALLLDAECGDLQETGRIDPDNLTANGGTTPSVDLDESADFDLHSVGGEQVRHDLQIEGIADVDERCSGQHNGFAVLNDPEDASTGRREHPDTAGRFR